MLFANILSIYVVAMLGVGFVKLKELEFGQYVQMSTNKVLVVRCLVFDSAQSARYYCESQAGLEEVLCGAILPERHSKNPTRIASM